jgi:hypothetical protein
MKKVRVSNEYIQDLIERYLKAGGEVTQVEEGVLGYGTLLLTNNGHNLKEFVIQEYYINAWSSGHWRMSYNNGLSKKYQQMLEDFLNREE